MKHEKYNPMLIGLDIVTLINDHVQQLAEDQWKDDRCPPVFWISLNNEDENNQSIMITINHLGLKFTERLFPRKTTDYGYKSIINQMINMYNRTM